MKTAHSQDWARHDISQRSHIGRWRATQIKVKSAHAVTIICHTHLNTYSNKWHSNKIETIIGARSSALCTVFFFSPVRHRHLSSKYHQDQVQRYVRLTRLYDMWMQCFGTAWRVRALHMWQSAYVFECVYAHANSAYTSLN